MTNAYDAERYGVIERIWFGLNKWVSTTRTDGAFHFATKGATTITHLPYWYPKGPILIKKVGYVVTTAINSVSGSGGYRVLRFRTRGASASVVANMTPSSATIAVGTLASAVSFTVAQCKAGEYIAIKSASQTTAKGTEKLCTQTGAFACFIDYVRTFSGSKHDL